MPPTYIIRHWSSTYEQSDAKRTKEGTPLKWVAIPTKHDGRGFRRLMRRDDGMEIFAAFILMAEVAAKMPVRGRLRDEDGPLTALDLSDKTGAPSKSFDSAFNVLSNKELGIYWLEVCQTIPEYPEVAPSTYDTRRNDTRRDKTRQDKDSAAGASGASKPEHAAFIAYFCERWENKYGSPYRFNKGKDGDHVKRILDAVERDLERAKGVIDAYLADDDKLARKARHTLGILLSQILRFTVPEQNAGNGELRLEFTGPTAAQLKADEELA